MGAEPLQDVANVVSHRLDAQVERLRDPARGRAGREQLQLLLDERLVFGCDDAGEAPPARVAEESLRGDVEPGDRPVAVGDDARHVDVLERLLEVDRLRRRHLTIVRLSTTLRNRRTNLTWPGHDVSAAEREDHGIGAASRPGPSAPGPA